MTLVEERKLGDSARLQIELLNRQVFTLRDKLSTLGGRSMRRAKDQGAQIADPGGRLNNCIPETAKFEGATPQ